ENEKLVLELSSFQLLGIKTFKPRVAALLNLFEAHLDYHGTIENYNRAKMNIFKNQTESDFLIYNADDPIVKEVIKEAQSTLIPFSSSTVQLDGAYVLDGDIYFKN